MNDIADRRPESIDDALGRDHERLDRLLATLEAEIRSGSPAAGEVLGRFVRGLEHHMAWEDSHLFPAVKTLASEKERRSIESLEIDHERLRDTLRSLDSTLAAENAGGAEVLVGWLRTLLKGHNYDEEHGVYVEADRLLAAAEKRRLIERFETGRPREPP